MFCKYVLIDGHVVRNEDAKINVTDMAVLFGFGVFESIHVSNRQPVSIVKHLERFTKALAKCNFQKLLNLPISDYVRACIEHNDLVDGQILIVATAGVDGEGGSVVILAKAFTLPKSELRLVKAKVLPEFRSAHSDMKLTSCASTLLTRNDLLKSGFDEAIAYRGDCITEGLSSAICVVFKDKIVVVSSTHPILPSVSLKNLCQVFDRNQLNYVSHEVKLDDLKDCEEIWMVSSTWGIRAVKMLFWDGIEQELQFNLAQKVHGYYQLMLNNQEFD
ncbi:hypothetical protein NCCP2140_09380 [Pseudoalteromonas sp. NCCP-2140]|uniref:aminotransferase class IV n=1 Tax=Pseudoalteromonas sp. NCCP-2140 TaxID=2942288 RepID=UPI00203E4856|nr:aminotransferase class IV [Pseudoalteromonas sp. NCCP-2140]GKW51885.1 hypothetical protein NCCP2140_09380 [Pseudoalteromonas sp. NCCP-2140]